MTVYSIYIRKSSLVPFMLAVTIFAIPLLSGSVGMADPQAPRRIISLNGQWQVAAGTPDQQPAQFDRTIPVPGVVDMATPPFEDVGRNTKFADDGGHKFIMIPDPHYSDFWYRRTSSVEGEVPPVAVLKLAKAKYGTRVWLNGYDLGKHWPCFTPGYFDVHKHLKGDGQDNELIVCVNAVTVQRLSVGQPTGRYALLQRQ
jgi:beta-galactosidase